MQLDFAFLAQTADFLESDGKLIAWGIGIDGIKASRLPFQASAMALVARILLFLDEPEQGHTYAVKVIAPDGEEKTLCENENLNIPRQSTEQPSASNLIVALSIFYESDGVYRFKLLVDGEVLKEIPLRVTHVPGLSQDIPLAEATEVNHTEAIVSNDLDVLQ